MARLQKTLTDYIVIAISPALIMILIGSLVFFLVEAFYQGEYEGRVRWIFGCFVFAAVLIGRISIDEGREYAAFFAVPLALALLLVLPRFVQFQGPMANFSTLINIGLIAIVWWCADKLTWDCTVIDEREDASGEGLLQTAGLDRPEDKDQPDRDPTLDLEATSSREPQPVLGWWERMIERRRRPHAPGVWVIYISLAALPLFGIGQRFISDLEGRRYAFWMLVYFVASALGLLLTSSFLGLRRYLRQRHLEMPGTVAGVWLVTGTTMILVLLVLCTAFPRPNPEYSITHAQWPVGSPTNLRASRLGAGRDGAEDPDRTARVATVKRQPAESEASEEGGREPGGDGKRPRDGGRSAEDSAGKPTPGRPHDRSAQGGKPKATPEDSTGNQDSATDRSDQKGSASRDEGTEMPEPGAKTDGDAAADNGQSAGSDQPQDLPNDDRARGRATDESPQRKGQPGAKASSGGSQSESEAEDSREVSPESSQATNSSRSPLPSPGQMLNTALASIPQAIKWLYYLAFFAIVAILVWKYRTEVLAAIRGFIEAIRDFWAKLFGGRDVHERAEDELAAAAPLPPPPPFSSFADPFLTGEARRLAPDELVVYSFRALEAWGREHDCPRMEDQTPHEFADRLGFTFAEVGRQAIILADLYCAAAYSTRPVSTASVNRLERLWSSLAESPKP